MIFNPIHLNACITLFYLIMGVLQGYYNWVIYENKSCMLPAMDKGPNSVMFYALAATQYLEMLQSFLCGWLVQTTSLENNMFHILKFIFKM